MAVITLLARFERQGVFGSFSDCFGFFQTLQSLTSDLHWNTLEDRKYGYFWIFPHHFGENIPKYFEFLDTFGYSPIISEPVSKQGGLRPPEMADSGSEIMGEYPKVSKNSKYVWIFSQLWWGNIQNYPYFLSSRCVSEWLCFVSRISPALRDWNL